MKSKTLLLKNAFRSSWKVKSQLFGISLLVMLMTIILSLVSSSNEQISNKNDQLNKSSNLRDGIFDIQNSKSAKTPEDSKAGDVVLPKDQTYLYQYYFDKVAKEYDLSWSRTEARSFAQLKENGKNISMKVVTKSTPPSNDNKSVDSVVVTSGNNFSISKDNDVYLNREMIINENFAKLNGINIGDIVRVEKDKYGESLLVKNSNNLSDVLKNQLNTLSTKDFIEANSSIAWFHISGFGTSSDFATPITDITTSFPDSATSFIGYVKPINFGLSKSTKDFMVFDQTKSLLYGTEFGKESYFSFKFNSKHPSASELSNSFDKTVLDEGTVNDKILYFTGDSSYEFSNRLSMFNTVITAYNVIALFLFIITILISLFALSIVLRKRVEAVKSQMGCLKALGYWRKEILLNFLAIPSITAAIGVTTGYLISLGLSAVVIHTFSTFFSISFGVYTFSVVGYFTTFLVGFLLLTVFASILILIEIKKPALELLKGKNTSKYSFMGTMIKSAFAKANFDTRLKMSIFAGSWLKFVGTFVTIFASTILITFTSITPSVIAKNETASFEGMDYEFVTEYQQPIAENPLSFYKTFNPNHTKTPNGKDYGYDINKQISDYISPNQTKDVYTSLPTEGEKIDYTTLFSDLLNNNISRYSYSPNIVIKDNGMAPGSSRMAYLNYQILTETYLSALDKFGPEISAMAAGTLKAQWTDLVTFEESLNNKNISNDDYVLKFLELTLSFYKRYINGLPITFNPTLIEKGTGDNKYGDVNYTALEKSITKSKMFKKLSTIEGISDELGNLSNLVKVDPAKVGNNAISEDIIYGDEDNKIDLLNLTNSDLGKLKENESKKLAIQLAAWFNLFFENRISMYLMQTAYSRAPYFVQENIKNALINIDNNSLKDKPEFSVAFNVVPYDSSKEVKGTMLKAKTSNDASINVYGLNANDTSLVDLKDSKGHDLYTNLFNTFQNENPIIINESLAKSMGYKVGDSIELDVVRNQLQNKEGEPQFADITQLKKAKDSKGYTESYITESNRSYQSIDGQTFADQAIMGIKPVKLGGNDTSAGGALGSTGQTKINKAMEKGEIITTDINIKKTFTVKGIQKSFGKPQAWTTNDITNNVLGYNETRETIFENWFKSFDLNSKPLIDFIFENKPEISETVISNINSGGYKHLKFLAREDNNNYSKYYEKYLAIFENTYPIFNYKYSNDDNINDITKSMSTTTPNGDFSAVGLNGSYKYKERVPEKPTYEAEDPSDIPDLEIDPGKFISGYAVGATASAVPMDQARLVLSQLTKLVQMITIMFIVFAMVISSIIILLVTSIVIHENSQFIATMKLLGYRKRYIIWQIISIYLVAILVAYIIGFTIGWFSFMGVTNYLAYQGSWILPVQFSMWMPLEVLGLLGIVFLATFYAAYDKIKKLTPVEALNA